MRAKESLNRNLMRLPKQFQKQCFQRSKQKLYINFPLKLGRVKISKPFAHVQKVQIFWASKALLL
jgi:hypothetical protein